MNNYSDMHPGVIKATEKYKEVWETLSDKSYWPVKMFLSINVFLWHLEAFEKDEDPVPLFINVFERATQLMQNAANSNLCIDQFPYKKIAATEKNSFENEVSGLFSDIWIDMTDDIYFDQTFNFTRERMEKNDINPYELFNGKTVLDAGCGSGKFSAAIARFGASKVIGLDIGDKGLGFARVQAKKVPYGANLDYRQGSLLDIPLEDSSIDLVWSNGVVHHTTNYEKCISEFSRVLKLNGHLIFYVNGRFGLFELLQDTMRLTNADIPRSLFQHFIKLLDVDTGRLYWLMDCLYAPYEYKSKSAVEGLLDKYGLKIVKQLVRGVDSDQIEQVSKGLPYADKKYGEAQLKFLAVKVGI